MDDVKTRDVSAQMVGQGLSVTNWSVTTDVTCMAFVIMGLVYVTRVGMESIAQSVSLLKI